MDPLFPLQLTLPRGRSGALLRSLHAQLRSAILEGRLRPGLCMPATRALAEHVGVSRNTVVAAYELLLSEGYLNARRGTGTYVADAPRRFSRPRPAAGAAASDGRLRPYWRRLAPLPVATAGAARFDFRLGLADNGAFPYRVWKRLSARALRALARAPVAYAEPQGRPELREAIAGHVSFTRAVACAADDVVVTAGAQQAFDLLCRILVNPGKTVVAVEEPGYPPLRAVFEAGGADVRLVPVDEQGLRVDRLPKGTRIVCVTPSHQFPSGVAMSPERRAALLDFAHSRNAVIVEDDYDGEFRFGGRSLDALQTLDGAGSVFYVGTFSKSLFPSLRLGFVVAPSWAVRALVAAKQLSDWHGPVLTQATLAAFIAEGHLARHVRRMRRIYGERRARLLESIDRYCGDRLLPIQGEAGLHIAARLEGSMRAGDLAERVAARGVRLQALERYCAGKPAVNGLVFGYAMIDVRHIEEAVQRVAQALSSR